MNHQFRDSFWAGLSRVVATLASSAQWRSDQEVFLGAVPAYLEPSLTSLHTDIQLHPLHLCYFAPQSKELLARDGEMAGAMNIWGVLGGHENYFQRMLVSLQRTRDSAILKCCDSNLLDKGLGWGRAVLCIKLHALSRLPQSRCLKSCCGFPVYLHKFSICTLAVVSVIYRTLLSCVPIERTGCSPSLIVNY